MPVEIRAFVEEYIINKRRGSPPLSQNQIEEVVQVSEDVVDSSEHIVHKIFRSAMFPTTRPGVAEGGNSPFSRTALPRKPGYF